MCLDCPMVHDPQEDLTRRVQEVTVKVQKQTIDALQEENYKLKRQHELLLSFNYIPLLEQGDDVVDVIERAIDYSRRALGKPTVVNLEEVEDWATVLSSNPDLQKRVFDGALRMRLALAPTRKWPPWSEVMRKLSEIPGVESATLKTRPTEPAAETGCTNCCGSHVYCGQENKR